MKRYRPALRLACLIVSAVLASPAVRAGGPAEKSPPDPAAPLVEAALDAELAGDAARRSDMLDKARRANPASAAARWHSGQVYFDGQWRTVDQISSLVAQDPRRQEYRDRRAAAGDSPDDHYQLARWCASRSLSNEARYHWARLLLEVPDHEEARQRLDLHEYEGGLYTAAQIEQYKTQRAAAKKNYDHFKPMLLDVRRRAAVDSAAREAALDELRQLVDPAALPALDEVATFSGSFKRELTRKLGRDGARQFQREFHLAAIAALGNMPQHEATLRLAAGVVDSPWPEGRRLAADLLQRRPKTDYVPMLIGSLIAPIEADINLSASLDGVFYGHTLTQATPEGIYSSSRTRDAHIVIRPNTRGRLPSALNVSSVVQRSAVAAARVAHNTQQQVAVANFNARQHNLKIQQALKMTAGLDVDLDAEPQVWWQAWRDENELYYDEANQPVYQDLASQYYYIEPKMTSCFPAGTPVWTDAGPVPIETIKTGDMILCQSPATGELAYRPAMETTLRPPSRTVSLFVNGETIAATLGHRFWVNGRGWEMAKRLQADMPLHSLTGHAALSSIEESAKGEEVEAYNLAVDEFHTYFVGASRLLVHDNSCPQPTAAALPGR